VKKQPNAATAAQWNADLIDLASLKGKRWQVSFDEPELTSDAGIAAVQASGVGEDLIDALADAIHDRRRTPVHSVREILSQRLHLMMAGFHHGDDSDRLRHDSVFQSASGRDVGAALASQPTVSRLENSVGRADILRLSLALLEWSLGHCQKSKKTLPMLVIDLDPSAHVVYGQQELGFFNGYVGDTCLMPFYILDGVTGRPLGAVMREGTTPNSGEILAVLRRIVEVVRRMLPETRILLRADGHLTKPAVMDWMEQQTGTGVGEVSRRGVEYVTGLPGNKVLERLFAPAVKAAADKRARLVEQGGDASLEITIYTEATYAARSWSRQRRVVARIIAGPLGVDVRYVVTSLSGGSAQYIYQTIYCGRGEAERCIRECKSLGSDTSPCTSATANAFRLIQHMAAYGILHRFREVVLEGTRWSRSMLGTIQLQLLKSAARVVVTARKVSLHLSARIDDEVRGAWRRAACARAPG
jgi:hypothetical protein